MTDITRNLRRELQKVYPEPYRINNLVTILAYQGKQHLDKKLQQLIGDIILCLVPAHISVDFFMFMVVIFTPVFFTHLLRPLPSVCACFLFVLFDSEH